MFCQIQLKSNFTWNAQNIYDKDMFENDIKNYYNQNITQQNHLHIIWGMIYYFRDIFCMHPAPMRDGVAM